MTDSILASLPLGAESVFPKEEYDRRLALAQAGIAGAGLDLLLLSGAENIFYLTGQQTPGYYMFQCLCVPAEGAPFIVLRGLEAMNARMNTYLEDITGYADDVVPAVALGSVLKSRGWIGKKIGVDRNSWFFTVNIYDQLVAEIGELGDGSGIVEKLRRIKSPLELRQMEASARANDAGMLAGLAASRAGASENDIAAAIMGAAIAAGSEYVGMEPFVTSGPRSGIPHSTWRRRKIVEGDLIALETTACYNRYHTALFRTVTVGKVPDDVQPMYDVCEEGLAMVETMLKPGNTCAEVHNAVQAIIDKAGYTEGYRKRTGYGIGISFAPDWGEGNIIGLFRGIDIPLEPGMTFHAPITLRSYNRFTVAVSETFVVTETGCRVLGAVPRGIHAV